VEIEEEEQHQMLIEENRDTMEPVYHRGVLLLGFRGTANTEICS